MSMSGEQSVTHRKVTLRGVAITALGLLPVSFGDARAQTLDEVAVRRTAEAVLAAISSADSAALRALLFPGAPVVSVRGGGGSDSAFTSWRTAEEVIRGIGGSEAEYLERMWNPEIRVSGDIATVWTPYDFYVDREFSHCGIDAFQVARTRDGWKVVSLFYTVVRAREPCPPSPLGPPRW